MNPIGSGWWAYALLTLGAVVVAAPFVVMIINSFKPGPEIMHSPLSLPERWTVSGFVKVFESLGILTMFGNSLFISGSVAVLNVLFDSMVAYALAKLRFPGRQFLFGLVLGSMMIPSILLLIPTYSMMYEWGWVNTYRVMILPASVSAYHIFLIRQYFSMIPDAYIEAARMDGAGEWRIFWRIVLPMSKPVLATVAILCFMGSWNDLFSALLYLRDESMFTLQLGLYSFKTRIPGQFLEQLWAATTLVTLPVVVVFVFLQKYFVEAFTGAGLK
jgi:multiple sugar transport system permease protein